MFRYTANDWHWGDEPLGLVEPEPALLVAMLKERGEPRQPHVWLARARHQPYSPAAGRAWLGTLQRKLQWAEAPAGTIRVDPVLGALIPDEAEVAADEETRAALGLDPSEPEASTA